VRRAIEAVAGGQWPEMSKAAEDNCREDSLNAARRWAERLSGPGDYLHVLTARLARLAKLENQFQAALEAEKLASLAEFAAGAGHEINNPLTVITGRAQMLLQSETHPQRRRDLALISAQALRVYEMIADMRLFARPPRPQLEPVELASVIRRAVESLQEQAHQQQTQIITSLPEEPITLQADPTQLIVAVRAMVQNSLEALGHGGQVEVSAVLADATTTHEPSADGVPMPVSLQPRAGAPQDDRRPALADEPELPASPGLDTACGRAPKQVEITITDNGPGITPEERRHIFDPFFSARQAGRGLGMGLSKCWRIVTNHGGSIEVTSQPGQGATFRIRLPVEP
jgi:signal transduction histidine kinase